MKKTIRLIALLGLTLLASCQGATDSSLTSAESSMPESSDVPVSLPDSSLPDSSLPEISSESQSQDSSSALPEFDLTSIISQLHAFPFAYKGTVEEVSGYTNEGTQTFELEVKGYFSSDRYYRYMEDSEGYDSLWDCVKDKDGNAASQSLNPVTNQIEETVQTDYEGNPISFDSLSSNPFSDIDEGDLKVVSATELKVSAAKSRLRTIAEALTGYDYTVEEMTLTIGADGKISSINISQSDSEGYVIEEREATLTLCTLEDLSLPVHQPRPANQDLEPLRELFADLKEGNYTVDTTVTDVGSKEQTKTGKVYMTSEGLISHTDEDPFSGWLLGSDGLAPVIENSGALVGYAAPTADADLASTGYVPAFDIAPEMFDVSADKKTFTLAAGYGFEDYAEHTLPDLLTYKMPAPDDGSLTIEIKDDGTYLFSFVETISLPGLSYSESVAMTVSDIGTTVLPFTEYHPFIAVPTSWSQVFGAEELIESFSIPVEELPFYFPGEGASWRAFPDSATPQLQLDLTAAMDSTAVAQAISDLLLKDGWTETAGKPESYYEKTLDSGTEVKIGIYDTDQNTVMIRFYDPFIPNDITRFLENSFSETTDYTQSGTIKYVYAPYDHETGKVTGEYTTEDFASFEYKFTQDSALINVDVVDPEYPDSSSLLVNDGSGYSVYTIDEDNTAHLYSSYEDSLYQDNYYTMKDCVGYQVSPKEGEEGVYGIDELDDGVVDAFGGQINLVLDPEYGDMYSDFSLALSDDGDSLTITYRVNDTIYYDINSETGEFENWRDGYYLVSFTVSDVNQTEIDLSAYGITGNA